MKNLLRHIIWITSVIIPALLPSACNRDTRLADELPPDELTAMLVLSTDILGKTRTGDASRPTDPETMHTLRIVILHQNGSVEHNRFIDFGNFPQTECTRIFEVKQNEIKKIYLIANEQSIFPELHGKLTAYLPGTSGFKEEIDDLFFTPDYTKPIPMSSVYEVEIEAEPRKECRFHLVRAAAKFTFRFINQRDKPVTVDSIGISAIAEKTYAMPHKKNFMMDYTEQESGKTESLFWIDWMKRVADESQSNPEDKDSADKKGWIQDYDIPPENPHRQVIVIAPERFEVNGVTNSGQQAPASGQKLFPAFYLPESKNLKDAGTVYGEQTYFMSLYLTTEDQEKSITCSFDNLKALFRNTHVQVEVTFWEKGVRVDVRPYSEVELTPDFGL